MFDRELIFISKRRQIFKSPDAFAAWDASRKLIEDILSGKVRNMIARIGVAFFQLTSDFRTRSQTSTWRRRRARSRSRLRTDSRTRPKPCAFFNSFSLHRYLTQLTSVGNCIVHEHGDPGPASQLPPTLT